MFGEVVSAITEPRSPINVKVSLANTVTDPIIAHIHCFGFALGDFVVGNADADLVVGFERGGRLGIAEFSESGADLLGFAAGMEEAGDFGFRSRGHNFFKLVGIDQDGAVVLRRGVVGSRRLRWVLRIVAEIVIVGDTGLGEGLREIRGVGVCAEAHITGVETHDGVRMRCSVVEKVDECIHGRFSADGLG